MNIKIMNRKEIRLRTENADDDNNSNVNMTNCDNTL